MSCSQISVKPNKDYVLMRGEINSFLIPNWIIYIVVNCTKIVINIDLFGNSYQKC